MSTAWYQAAPGLSREPTPASHSGVNESHSLLSLTQQLLPHHVLGCLLPWFFFFFFCFLWAGEFTVNSPYDTSIHLSLQDLQLDSTSNPTCLCVHIKCSKMDPFHQGCFIYLGSGHSSICPIASLMAYLHLCGPTPDPLFVHQDGQPLSWVEPPHFLQSTLSAAETPGSFSRHSFRIGATSTAARQGLPDHLITTMGHWSSNAYQLYVRIPVQSILEVMGRLL